MKPTKKLVISTVCDVKISYKYVNDLNNNLIVFERIYGIIHMSENKSQNLKINNRRSSILA